MKMLITNETDEEWGIKLFRLAATMVLNTNVSRSFISKIVEPLEIEELMDRDVGKNVSTKKFVPNGEKMLRKQLDQLTRLPCRQLQINLPYFTRGLIINANQIMLDEIQLRKLLWKPVMLLLFYMIA
nr:hypothetical protein [Tanacetum cinerariifolium]